MGKIPKKRDEEVVKSESSLQEEELEADKGEDRDSLTHSLNPEILQTNDRDLHLAHIEGIRTVPRVLNLSSPLNCSENSDYASRSLCPAVDKSQALSSSMNLDVDAEPPLSAQKVEITLKLNGKEILQAEEAEFSSSKSISETERSDARQNTVTSSMQTPTTIRRLKTILPGSAIARSMKRISVLNTFNRESVLLGEDLRRLLSSVNVHKKVQMRLEANKEDLKLKLEVRVDALLDTTSREAVTVPVTYTMANQYIYLLRKIKDTDLSFISRLQLLKGVLGAKSSFFELVGSAEQIVRRQMGEPAIWLESMGDVNSYNTRPGTNPVFHDADIWLWGRGKFVIFSQARYLAKTLIESKFFRYGILFCILANTLVLGLDRYNIPDSQATILSNLNLCFTIIFLAEMLVKWLGKGFQVYFKDRMNYLDCSIVIISMIELGLNSNTSSAYTAFRAFRVFRIFRVLRVSKLFRYLDSLALIMAKIGKSSKKFVYMALMLLLFLVIYSFLGMQLFATELVSSSSFRPNFDTFEHAFMTVFQLLTLKEWPEILYHVMLSDRGYASCIYIISWIVIGNYVFLNLFLAIVLQSFSEQGEDEENSMGDMSDISSVISTTSMKQSRLSRKLRRKHEHVLKLIDEMEDLQSITSLLEIDKTTNLRAEQGLAEHPCSASFFIFTKRNPIRKFSYDLIRSRNFERVMLAIIVTNTLKLIWDTYLYDDPSDSSSVLVSDYLDLCYTVIFSIELVLKTVALGFVLEKETYLRDTWNVIDLVIVVTSLLDLIMYGRSNLYLLQVLKVLRTLRPLRLISHNNSLRLVVSAIIESLTSLMHVGVIVLVVMLMFSIVGVSLFSGGAYSCTMSIITTEDECVYYGYEWLNSSYNFDDVVSGMLTLFVVMSFDHWPVISRQFIDSRGPGLSPQMNSQPTAGYYFIIFIVVGTFFFLNLFKGVVFERFHDAKKKESSLSVLYLSKDQLFWVDMQSLIINAKPFVDISEEPRDTVRRSLFRLCKTQVFEAVVLAVVLGNTIIMAMEYETASATYTQRLEYANLICNIIFILEAGVKLLGFGPHAYFHLNWNKFDFLIVISSFIDVILTWVVSSTSGLFQLVPQLGRIVRVTRVLRLLRLAKRFSSLQEIVKLMRLSLPSVMNVLAILLLLLLIYAILGVALFHSVNKGEIVDEFINFHNFLNAFFTMFRSATGEDWNLVMDDCGIVSGRTTAVCYFYSFVLINSFIMLNLFIMVMVQHWEENKGNPDSAYLAFSQQVETFNTVWEHFSKLFGGVKISVEQYVDFLYALGPMLGLTIRVPDPLAVRKIQMRLNLISSEGFIYYNDLLYSVLRLIFSRKIPKPTEKLGRRLMEREEISTQKKLTKLREHYKKKLYGESRSKFMSDVWGANLFFSFLTMKSVFNGWRGVVQVKKRKLMAEKTQTIGPLEVPHHHSWSLMGKTRLNSRRNTLAGAYSTADSELWGERRDALKTMGLELGEEKGRRKSQI